MKTAYDAILQSALDTLEDSTFLARCQDGSITRQELRDFLVQQFHYSRHFTRYLCALLANLANEGDRASLTGNLFEEMGLGGTEQIPHSKIYRDMLANLGLDPALVPVAKETRELSETMLKLCSKETSAWGTPFSSTIRRPSASVSNLLAPRLPFCRSSGPNFVSARPVRRPASSTSLAENQKPVSATE